MGTITNDMRRLRDEIGASRAARREFMQKDVAGALDAVHNALVDLRAGVDHTLVGFRADRRKMMKQTRKDRREFIVDLQEKVAGLRNDVLNLRHVAATDLSGARVAFFGPSAQREARKPGCRRPRGRKS